MSNTKNLANLASALDDGTSGQVLQSTGSGGVQFADSTGSGVTVHANQAAMLTDAASASEGTLHYETGTNKLYVKQSSGFYLLASITNASPTIDSFSENTGGAGANNLTAGGTFTLTAGSNTVVTINATEPDLETISYSATVTSGTATDVFSSPSFPVSNQSSNVFTLTPATSGTGGTVTIRFDASDGTNVANVSHSFEIVFQIADSHYTSLLMATDGSAGNNQDDISDSSSSNNTITPYGNVHAGTFSPYRHGGYSTLFDGASDYIQVPAGAFALSTGDFTIETWVYFNSITTGAVSDSVQYMIYDARSSASATDHFMSITTSGDVRIRMDGIRTIELDETLEAGKWYHLALVNSGGTVTLFLNGTANATTFTTSANLSIGSAVEIGGSTNSANYWLDGYLRDFRIANEVVYSGAFTPPTASLTTTGGEYSDTTNVNTSLTTTQLLTCHLPYLADGSSNGHSITVTGSVETKPIGPYDYSEYSESTNGGSVYFDGNGDYVSVSDLGLSGDITIEGWFYQSVAQSATYRCALGASTYSTNGEPLRIYTYNSIYSIWLTNTGGPHISGSFTANTWHHVALVRSSGTWTLYIDGTSAGTSTTNGTYNFASTVDWTLGADAATTYPFTGYLSDVRVVEGTAVYSGAFTPPTGPLTTTGGTYPSTTNVDTSITASNTSLLLSGTDAHVLDKSQSSNLKLVGTAASTSALTSGSTPPYIGAAWANTSAVSFDGTGDYVTIPNFEDIGSGNFTIEMFIYQTASGAFPTLFSTVANSATSNGLRISTGNNNNTLQVASAGSALINASSAFNNSTWNHVALVRSGTTLTLYLNGSSVGSVTNSQNFVSDTFYIGDVTGTGSPYTFTGYIQDLRVSVGEARYTSNFTVPSTPLRG